jgi:hypothetical protein
MYDNSTGQIENNIIFHNSGFGLNSHSNSQNIVNNTIFNQNAGGIWISGGTSGHNIYNNIIYNVGIGNNSNQAGVASEYSSDSNSNSAYVDNLIFMSSGGQGNNWALSSSGPTITGYINASPQFVNYTGDQNGDYHLAPGSPAIGSGTQCPAEDFDGNTRSGACTRGAYGAGGGSPTPTPNPNPTPVPKPVTAILSPTSGSIVP